MWDNNLVKISVNSSMIKLLSKINKAAIKFLETNTLDDVYGIIMEESCSSMESVYCAITVEKNGKFERIFASDGFLYAVQPRPFGYTYKTYQSQKILIIDAVELKQIHPELKKKNINSIVFIPLFYRNRSIGVLTLYLDKNVKSACKDREMFSLFGHISGLALRKALINEQKQKALTDKKFYKDIENSLKRINSSAIKFLVPLSLKDTYETIVKEAVKLTGGHFGSLTLEIQGEFKEVYSTLPIRINRRRKGFTYKAFKEVKVYLIHTSDTKEFRKVHPEVIKFGIKSIVLIPLLYKRKSIGVLIVNFRRKVNFSKDDLDILLPFGSLASLAIKKSQLHDQMQKTIKERDLFISMAAHELRTPLTAINGYIQLMLKKVLNNSNIEARWVRDSFAESLRLTNLVNDLLEISRIRAGKMQYMFKEWNIQEIIESGIGSFNIAYPNRKIIFKNQIRDQGNIIGDSSRLIQVVINILENAAKFSPPEKEIIVTLEKNKFHYVLSIEDRGKGINTKDIKRVFTRFYKGSETTEEGMGLGLFLVKNVVQQHHGKIKIFSKLNEGTKVEIKLPQLRL